VTRTVVRLPAGEEFRGAEVPDFAISPDGSRLVFATRPSTQTATTLYLREIGRFEPRAFPDAGSVSQPVFSPDGESVAFVTMPQPSIVKMALDDGVVTKVCDVPGTVWGLAWTENGDILFGNVDRGIFRVSADGGAPEPLTFLGRDEGAHQNPKPLPGGRGLLFTVGRSGGHYAALSRGSAREHVVLFEGYGAAYVETGYIVFGFGGSSELLAVPFDIDRLEVQGPPVTIEAGVYVSNNSQPQFQVGQGGTLVYASGKASRSSVVWVSRDGTVETVQAFDGRYHSLDLAPDGSRFVADDVVGQNFSIWGHDLARGTRFLVTSGAGLHVPRFTLDGAEVVYAALDGDLFIKSADGTGEARSLLAKENSMFPLSWSPDGKLLAFRESHPDTGADLWILPLDIEGGESYPFVQTPANEAAAAFSPDGRYFAYQSDESGRPEIYIQPFPGPGVRVLVSTAGGKEPVFSSDGRELFYRQGTALVAVPIAAGPVLQVGKPEVLFDGPYQADAAGHSAYDVSPDGNRFLMIRNENAGGIELHVVLNLGEELKAKVPRR
jgi:Tol biopolymer transport system component